MKNWEISLLGSDLVAILFRERLKKKVKKKWKKWKNLESAPYSFAFCKAVVHPILRVKVSSDRESLGLFSTY